MQLGGRAVGKPYRIELEKGKGELILFQVLFGRSANIDGIFIDAQVSSKWDSLKKDYRSYRELQKMSGVGSAAVGRFEHSVWDQKVKVYPDIKKWRRADFTYYEDMMAIVGDCVPDFSEMQSTAVKRESVDVDADSNSPAAAPVAPLQRTLIEEQECEDLCNGVVPSGGQGSRATTPTNLLAPRTPSSSGGSKAPSSSGGSSDRSTPSVRWGGKRQKIGLADALTTIAGQQQVEKAQQQVEKDAELAQKQMLLAQKKKLLLLAQKLMREGKISAANAGKMLARISTMAPEMVDFFVQESALLQPDPDGDVLTMFCNFLQIQLDGGVQEV